MPLIDTSKTFCVVLEIDSGKPKELRPEFVAASQTMRGQIEIFEALDYANEADAEVQEVFQRTIAMLKKVIVGWKNVAINGLVVDFDALRFDEVLSIQEARELLRKIAHRHEVSADEKKESA